MSRVMMSSGINEVMVAPFTKIIKTPALAYWTIGLLMMFISWFSGHHSSAIRSRALACCDSGGPPSTGGCHGDELIWAWYCIIE